MRAVPYMEGSRGRAVGLLPAHPESNWGRPRHPGRRGEPVPGLVRPPVLGGGQALGLSAAGGQVAGLWDAG